ncbi:MAG TPA: DUF1365 domain-containing protein [Anaeromyxobacteraceae bacterium]|nr:DUF1365 domain-containing protein [Anaeromyxobacteraceae bacterium]
MIRESAIYEGTVTHVRRAPRPHAFSYRVYLLYLDLGELPEILASPGPLREGQFGLLSFRRSDYLGETGDLADAARARVYAALGFRPQGPVRLLTHVRSLGYVFNPVSFYYCYAEDGRALEAVVAEITNTPWGERHSYVVGARGAGATGDFTKSFHVSPFFPMTQSYRWWLGAPGEHLTVEMRNEQDGTEVFRARLALRRRAWAAAAVWRAALLQPLMAWRVHAFIYWQALRLWAERIPFHPHPANGPAGAARRS